MVVPDFNERGLLRVRYVEPADLRPEAQTAVVSALEAAAAEGAVGIVFVVPDLTVDPSVPNFWLEVVHRTRNLVVIAVASPSLLVRLSTEAFGLANRLRRTGVAVRSFEGADEAMAWASRQLAAAASRAA